MINTFTGTCAFYQFLILIPSIILCYLPMKNQLICSPRKLIFFCIIIIIPYALLASWLYVLFKFDMNYILMPSLIVFFLMYRRTLKIDLSKALVVYFNVCALETFPQHFAFIFDAHLYPNSGAASFSSKGALFYLLLSCLLTLVLAYPTYRWFTWLIDNLNFPKIWYLILVIPIIFLITNILFIPISYQTLHTGRIFYLYPIFQGICLILLLFLQVLFYYIAVVILEKSRLQEQTQLLEMQANSYQTLQNHMFQTSRLRHDFKHTIHMLVTLANKEDLHGIKQLLNEYEKQPDWYVPIYYCKNTAMNALFNHYREMALSADIQIDWHLELPNPLTISELDMASLFGNIMENAITSCQALPKDQRYFSLSSEVKYNNSLFIVSTNRFNGQIKKDHEGYLSTRHSGRGMGLLSISAIANKYQGIARISNTHTEFFVDVMLKL